MPVFPHGVEVRPLQAGHRFRAARRPGARHRRARRRAEPRRQVPGAARRHRLGQDVHDGAVHRAREPPDAGHGAQQDAGGPALPGVPALLPRERRRVLRQLLRLLPARGLRPDHRLVHREGSDDQRRDRPHAPVGDAVAVRAPGRHHRRERLMHLRPGLAGGLLRDDAAARARPAHRPRADPAEAGRDPVRAERPRLRPRRLPRPRRHRRGLPVVRGPGAAHRAVRRRGRRADLVRSADRQDDPPARQGRDLPEDPLRHVARPDQAGGRDHQGGARLVPRPARDAKARCSRRTACTSGRCSTSR